jgi:hypothetical protein
MFVLEFVVRKRQQKILEQLLKIDFFSYLGIFSTRDVTDDCGHFPSQALS